MTKWLIMFGFMDLRWPMVARRSNVGLVIDMLSADAMHLFVVFISFSKYSKLTYHTWGVMRVQNWIYTLPFQLDSFG